MNKKRIVTLGEIMLRLSTPGFKRFVQSQSFDVCYGGGEANVCVSLANYGNLSSFITKVPNNEIGQSAINSLREFGVNTEKIAVGGERLGIYFLETGVSMRPSKVVYDRKNSSISQATKEDFDIENIFSNCDWFHFTGITPALSDTAYNLTLEFLKKAKEKNVMVSCDLNYRKKLWSVEKAKKCMTTLMPYVDVLIGNEEDIEKCLGYKVSGTDVSKGKLDLNGYKEVFNKLIEDFNFKVVATSLRTSYSASDNGWSGIIYDGKEFYEAKQYNIHLVDRVGGGDSFASGLIHGLVNNNNIKYSLEFAVAASALKQTIPGDFNMVNEEEVITLMNGDSSGRVQR